jgi:RND family efflux transporter MFP subunit
VAAAILAASTPFGCERTTPSRSAPSQVAVSEPVVEVQTARVRRGSILQELTAPGSLVAARQSEIGAEVRGRIVRVFVEEGDRLEEGDPLFQIDPARYEAALRHAEAGLALARSERRQVETDLARAQKLRREKVVAEHELDRLTTALEVARARQRQAAEAVALARQDLKQTLVRAPYAGSVAERRADEGTTALVQPQTIVVVLQETAELEARATIPESQLALVGLGDPALLHVEGLSQPIQTEVSAVSDTIDPATRTYLVTMRVPNPDHRLKAGVFSEVEILPQAKSDVILVPRASVRTEDGRTRVFTVRDGRATAVPVRLGLITEDDAEVLDGIRVDEPVIVGDAAGMIAPGMRVRVVDGERDSSP